MKKIVLKILGIVLVAIFFLQSNMAIAASSLSDVNKQIEEKEEEIDEIQEEKSATMNEVEELTLQISEYQNQIDELDSKIDNLNNQISEAESKINEAQAEYDKQEELLEARLVVAYEEGETSYLDVLLASESITDFISNYYLVTELATSDAELLESIQKQKEEIEQAKTNLENSKKELDTSKASKQSVATQLQSSKNEKDAKVAQLTSDEQQAQAELEQFEADKRAIQAELARIAEEEAKKQQSNGNNDYNSVPNNPSSSGYIRPIVGYSITTGWYGYAGHTGVDFSGSGIAGKPILAAKSGTVVTSTALKNSNGTYRSYGEYIVINHHDGTMTLYAHGAPGSRLVREGQSVSQGQQIMSVGTTGNSTGYHLHFEVRVNGKPVNPAPYLP